MGIALGYLSDLLPLLQHPLHQAGQLGQLYEHLSGLIGGEMVAGPPQSYGQEDDSHKLRAECLGSGNADLRAAAGVDGPVYKAGNSGAHHIGYGQAPPAAGLGLLQSQQCVCRLAGLGDAQKQSLWPELEVDEFRCHLHIHRQACRPGEEVFSQHTGMVGCAAGDDGNPLQPTDLLIAHSQIQPCLSIDL